MTVPQTSKTRAYRKPQVNDRGKLEVMTKNSTGYGAAEDDAYLLIWGDAPFAPAEKQTNRETR